MSTRDTRIDVSLLNEVQELSQVGHWELDIVNNQLFWSDEIYRIFEIDPNQFGASYGAFLNFVHPDDREYVDNAYTDSVNRRELYDIVHRLRLKDNKIKWVHEKCRTYYSEDGSPTKSIGTVQDITAHKEAELKFEKAYGKLEFRVRERTAQLQEANKKLHHAKQLAEEANKTKSRFLATASHDLRQPLQSLGSYISLLSKKLKKEDNQNLFGKIDIAYSNLSLVLDALLDISKIESGSTSPVVSDFPLQELLDKISVDLAPKLDEKNLNLEIQSTECFVHSDYALLQRILENLLANAVRYTQKGFININCKYVNNMALISIKDTGCGIPKDKINKIFDEYYQIDNPSRNHEKGLGLGLYIVRYLCGLLDYNIEVDSELGRGSVFSLAVPLAEKGVQEQQKPQKKSISGLNSSVLIIDDDEMILDSLYLLLEAYDFEVEIAKNSEEALKHIKLNYSPDIILSDYRLDGQVGTDVVSEIRESAGKIIPAIILTGDTSGDKIRSSGLENYTILHKPVDTENLIAMIGKMTCSL